ncbi:hypothetical protein GOP47_0024679 [Adiantum capillus-veneris]|uniref:Bifunctional dihydrofolate reductase-thymidylate synthase n=1 Tax=Adiantum capillus-veneris TaxID=13818 RepID=A0A9D4U290_ADICA|nr:hypothetical protein GOP47_0024679 [Adiantum capillus-veneris]
MAAQEQTHTPLEMRPFQIVVACTRELGIGLKGSIPWKLPLEIAFFKLLTSSTSASSKRNAVIMGRLTWESIPSKFRPLPGRLNIVLSRSPGPLSMDGDVQVCSGLIDALRLLAAPPYLTSVETVFVIGGGQVYKEAVELSNCDAIHITQIDLSCECDTFFPAFNEAPFRLWYSSMPMIENDLRFTFATYIRETARGYENGSQDNYNVEKPLTAVSRLPKMIREKHEEYQYLNLIHDIIQTGTEKGDRTGTGTLSKFGCQMRFNLRSHFPLLTTKRVFWRGVLEELLWFISGSTNAKVLQDKGVHIWDGNASRDYLDSLGLTEREEGDLGPVYGFQWRHFGAKYTDMHADYSGKGFDQLADAIQKLRIKPEDRRIILSAWNPSDLELMALPPCHMFAQFYVANGELSCQMYQRSCDMGLGVPFNIASYALLTCILAHVCDLKRGEFIHVLGDAHVYKNHVEPLEQQLKNIPKPFPVLKISTKEKDIDKLTARDFELIGYDPHKKIAMQMAV